MNEHSSLPCVTKFAQDVFVVYVAKVKLKYHGRGSEIIMDGGYYYYVCMYLQEPRPQVYLVLPSLRRVYL